MESQCSQRNLHTGHHVSPSQHPSTTKTAIRDGSQVTPNNHNNHVHQSTKLLMICCDHDTDPLLDPPKGRPQNGGRLWIKNRPPKRCPPTVGGHSLGGLKRYAEAAPDLVPSTEAWLFKLLNDSICVSQQNSIRNDHKLNSVTRRLRCKQPLDCSSQQRPHASLHLHAPLGMAKILLILPMSLRPNLHSSSEQ